MTPTKLLIGQMLVVFAIVLAGVWFATQWAAAELAHQPELGQPWFYLGSWRVYEPWALFIWWFEFDAYAPVVFDEAGGLAAASGLMGCVADVSGAGSTVSQTASTGWFATATSNWKRWPCSSATSLRSIPRLRKAIRQAGRRERCGLTRFSIRLRGRSPRASARSKAERDVDRRGN